MFSEIIGPAMRKSNNNGCSELQSSYVNDMNAIIKGGTSCLDHMTVKSSAIAFHSTFLSVDNAAFRLAGDVEGIGCRQDKFRMIMMVRLHLSASFVPQSRINSTNKSISSRRNAFTGQTDALVCPFFDGLRGRTYLQFALWWSSYGLSIFPYIYLMLNFSVLF